MPTYLVTGGTGSFGTACIARLLERPDTQVVRVYSRNEHRQQALADQLNGGNLVEGKLRCIIGDVRDLNRLRLSMRGCEVVIHAAALKSVPVAEYNPIECVRTNIDGTINVIEAAIWNGVHKVLTLSTDKAAAPLNLYGATKAVVERLVTQANNYRGSICATKFACVRYGNVVGSNGSVVRCWRAQVARGEPLTMTAPDATRFWMTLEQSVDFVLSSLRLMDEWPGGEVFIPRLPSIRLADLAEAIAPGHPQRLTGLRAGEKTHECLLVAQERMRALQLPDRWVLPPEHPEWAYALPEHVQYRVPVEEPYVSNHNELLPVERIAETLAAV